MPDHRREDPYALLGISRTASPREITVAYRRRVRELHPDTPGGDADLLTAVVTAYRLLHDRHHAEHEHDTQRDHQDDPGRAASGTPVPVDVRRGSPTPRREPDLRAGPVRHHRAPRH